MTRFDIALSPDSETVYGGDYSFDISALVRFDGMTDFKADKAAYSGRDIPRNMQTITLNYDGTGSDFFTSGTASLNADVTHIHTISEGYSYDETSHWKTCTGCDDKIDLEKHSFDGGVIITHANKKTEGEKVYTCTVCDYKKAERISRLAERYHIVISGDDYAGRNFIIYSGRNYTLVLD